MKVSKELKDAIMDSLMYQVDRNNYGMMSHYKMNHRSILILMENDVRCDLEKRIVTMNDEPLFKIERKFSSRKVNLMYKELKPKLIEVAG